MRSRIFAYMAAHDVPYPKLFALFLEHLETQRKKHFYSLLIALSAGGLTIWSGAYHKPNALILLTISIGYVIYSAAKLYIILTQLSQRRTMWRAITDDIHSTLNTSTAFQLVEEELDGDTSHFQNVVFTANYLIAFDMIEQGGVARVQDISCVRLYEDKVASGIRYYRWPLWSLFVHRGYYTMSCDVSPLGNVMLTRSEDEMRDMLYEIRVRHPDVLLDQEAHSYFFPMSGPVE